MCKNCIIVNIMTIILNFGSKLSRKRANHINVYDIAAIKTYMHANNASLWKKKVCYAYLIAVT